MRKIAIFALTTIGLFTVNFFTTFLGFHLIDTAFITGLFSTAIIYYFSSTGGFTSNHLRLQIQSQTGIKMDEEKRNFYPSIVFYTALSYTVISLIITFIFYKEYFL